VRADMHLAEGVDEADVERWVQSASTLHSNGDGFDLAVKDGRLVGVRGRVVDRVNRGRLDPKDVYGWEGLASPDRLTRPLVRRGGELVETDWDTAMGLIVDRSKELLQGPGGWGRFGFYTTGQLFLEEYYTLAVIGKAGIGTPHMDGNTRLCTATAGAALKQSFGTDGQPGSYADVDHCDTIALWGHNVAETQTVLWMRMLDRLAGPDRPRLVVADPRLTPVAREADVHLPVRPGTNLALMNGVLRELIANGWVDEDYVGEHTLGFDELRSTVEAYTPERVEEICGVDAGAVREAARILGTAERLLSTVLQGFYQSNQATAAACQVNNLHLLRGMIGRPGAGLYQMNGQPSAQNTRETGADGDLPGFRNWDNQEHIRQLAELWKVDPMTIPHWAPPSHAMQVFRQAELGSIKLLWISATNPAVSLPELARVRSILESEELLVVVQDLFLTETAMLADVVLACASSAEKTGTLTNADRTVHLCERAVDPPGEARADLDIFLDYARRMDFRDRDGEPLIEWHDPESTFEAWKECSRGRPCDYTHITYDLLRDSPGIQWGGERLYTDGRFNTNPGRAFLWTTEYEPSPEVPDDERPLLLTTGRTVYHFHTRTRTGRTPELVAAAPDVWVEVNAEDANRLGVGEGDVLRLESARGAVEAPVRVTGVRAGTVFVPFHYGYWDRDAAGPDGAPPRAANELTITAWDPVSKQPLFKVAAVRATAKGEG
jgi:ferredoxin-nitrate reductase